MRAIPVRKNPKQKKYTGNTLVVAESRTSHKSMMAETKKASIRLARSSDYNKKDQMINKAMDEADGIYIDALKIAVIKKEKKDEMAFLTSSSNSKISHTEKERYVYAKSTNLEYARGYRDAVNHLLDGMTGEEQTGNNSGRRLSSRAIIEDSNSETWGINAIGVGRSNLSGSGVKIAVLDTGFRLDHPDFDGRDITTRSFHRGLEVDDVDGHGTHCVGISCGGADQDGMRYGVASNAEIFVGKVLDNSGRGSDANILSGIGWAVENNCHIISMSLGGEAEIGDQYSRAYETAALRAMERGSLIIAAAGNESRRPGVVRPVNHPANCPSIMAVAALHQNLKVASYSNGIIGEWETEVDISAPGSNIYSSYLGDELYDRLSGTSMATPMVAGVAALLIEKYPDITIDQLWRLIVRKAKRIDGDNSSIGSGLVSL